MAKFTKEEFIAGIKEMSILEIKELVDAMKEEFGIDPSAVAVAGPAAGAAVVEAEQTEFDVILKSFGANKLAVIKAVKDATGLGLKEAKELVDGCPKPVKEKVSKEEAEALKAKLTEVGAEIEVK